MPSAHPLLPSSPPTPAAAGVGRAHGGAGAAAEAAEPDAPCCAQVHGSRGPRGRGEGAAAHHAPAKAASPSPSPCASPGAEWNNLSCSWRRAYELRIVRNPSHLVLPQSRLDSYFTNARAARLCRRWHTWTCTPGPHWVTCSTMCTHASAHPLHAPTPPCYAHPLHHLPPPHALPPFHPSNPTMN